MAHSHYHHSSNADDIAFITVIFLACSLFAHKAGLLKVEHMAKCLLLVIFVLRSIATVFRLTKRVRSWKLQRCPDMYAVDTMTGLAFERYVARLLRSKGYSQVSLTEEYDLGVDIIAKKTALGGVFRLSASLAW